MINDIDIEWLEEFDKYDIFYKDKNKLKNNLFIICNLLTLLNDVFPLIFFKFIPRIQLLIILLLFEIIRIVKHLFE